MARPSRFAVDSSHERSPNGLPRCADRRIASSSPFVSGSLTRNRWLNVLIAESAVRLRRSKNRSERTRPACARPNSASGESAKATTSVGQVRPFVANATVNPNAKLPPAASTQLVAHAGRVSSERFNRVSAPKNKTSVHNESTIGCALGSTYRHAARKCLSSWMGKLLNRP